MSYYLGIDIGSVSLNLALLAPDFRIVKTSYRRMLGRPLISLKTALEELLAEVGHSQILGLGITGTGGKLAGQLIGAEPVNEIIAQTKATALLYPQVRTIIEIGGQDSKLIILSKDGNLEDFAMNALCAAGTGSFLDQQASRLGVSIEGEFGELALKSKRPPRIAGRCSVFAKTDMIHLQQEATPIWDIISGLCFAMARSFKSNIGRGKNMTKPLTFQGGVAANRGMVRAFTEVLELKQGELIVPREHACMGAIGAAKLVAERRLSLAKALPEALSAIEEYLSSQPYNPPGMEPLQAPNTSSEPSRTTPAVSLKGNRKKIEGYLGIDVGSISTNLVVIDDQRQVLAKRYLPTAGQPLEAVRCGLREIGREIGHLVEIKGVGTTGSGRYLTSDFVGGDIVKNEITAQARAAANRDPRVDTIFEIGGQDSKFISLRDGRVVDFEMNKVCAAGTGSFLEEQAEKLGLQIKEEFGRMALSASSPVSLGERCTVFMESDLVHHQQQGASTDNLVAGLSYSIVYNYLNRVVGDRKVGDHISFQGGVAFNQGVVAAFRQVTGKPIIVPEHHEVTGAIGVAIIVQEKRSWEKSRFRGFDLADRRYSLEAFECPDCPNRCDIRKVIVERQAPLFYGSRCEKFNVEQKRSAQSGLDLFQERERYLRSAYQSDQKPAGPTVGFPRSLVPYYELYPFWQAFFGELGAKLIVSPRTNREIIRKGVETVTAEPCFPIKIMHGHVLDLLEKKIDYIFVPSLENIEQSSLSAERSLVCPYVQTIPYVIRSAFNPADYGAKLLDPVVQFNRGHKAVLRMLTGLGQQLGASSAQVKRAYAAARTAQGRFYKNIKLKGAEILATLTPDKPAVVIISRPYNGCDPGLNLELPKKLSDLGFVALPLDFLPLNEPTEEDWPNMYWRAGNQIIRAADYISKHPNLYPIYITNFGCGPDSFIIHFFRRRLGNRPYLQIEVDEHSADVGAITRCEAFKDSLESHRKIKELPTRAIKGRFSTPKKNSRTLYIPHMSDHALALAAVFQRHGVQAEIMPAQDADTLYWGRKHTSGKECYPCVVTTGDMVKVTRRPDFDPDRAAFFMPSGNGPCRFGQYNMFHRLVLDELGFENAPIFAPNQGQYFYREMGMVGEDISRHMWQGVIAVDFLDQILREFRPYEVNRGDTDRAYKECLDNLCEALSRSDKPYYIAMEETKERFSKIPVDRSQNRPVIGVVGEIFVRVNQYCNQDVAREIEKLGGEAWVSPVSEWFLYVNFLGMRHSKLSGDYRNYLSLLLSDWFQKRDEHKLQQIFKDVLRNWEELPLKTTLDYSSDYIDPSFEGEAMLSIGKSVDFARKDLAGIVNVLPFTCMPGNIVTSILKMLREKHRQIPCLNMALDSVEDTNVKTRLEAFMFQARQYHENLNS